ncbi:MAG: DUF420 domain-containing protein [Bdellovibrionota bacterium]|nr:DUF420 domain-containing protein [Bdellovibrionota bacterium]
MKSSLIFQTQSFIILSLLFFGTWVILKKKNRDLHVKTMLLAIVWDIILVLQIELSRGAIEKASKVTSNTNILNIHVSLAVSAVVLYVLMILTGKKVLKGNRDILGLHKKLGLLTLLMRTLTFITSFFAVAD